MLRQFGLALGIFHANSALVPGSECDTQLHIKVLGVWVVSGGDLGEIHQV